SATPQGSRFPHPKGHHRLRFCGAAHPQQETHPRPGPEPFHPPTGRDRLSGPSWSGQDAPGHWFGTSGLSQRISRPVFHRYWFGHPLCGSPRRASPAETGTSHRQTRSDYRRRVGL
ncbi:uncharacterized protein METZ01_LOCUS429520, partial [marine metagenome]